VIATEAPRSIWIIKPCWSTNMTSRTSSYIVGTLTLSLVASLRKFLEEAFRLKNFLESEVFSSSWQLDEVYQWLDNSVLPDMSI
jgi:hypothetical protein